MSAELSPAALTRTGLELAQSGSRPLGQALGRNLPTAFLGLLARSADDTAAVARLAAAVERLKVSADAGSLAFFRCEADGLAARAANLPTPQRTPVLEELAALRTRADLLERGSLRPGEVAPNHVTRPKAGAANSAARRAEEAIRIEQEAMIRMRGLAALRESPEALARATAIDRIGAVLGASHDGGWRAATEYLADNLEAIAAAERRYAAAVAQDAAGEATRAAAASRRGWHSKLKGILGECYASRCAEWLDLREAFVEVAARRASLLNRQAQRAGSPTRWTVRTVKGQVLIDGKLAWDEAVLLVEEVRPGMGRLRQAELVLAAQYKVEKRVSALEQVVQDAVRERGAIAGRARLAFEEPTGAMSQVELLSTAGAQRPTRLIFNADGGQLSPAQQAAFAAGNVQVQRGVLKASVSEFDSVADVLLAAAAAIAGT